MSEKVNLFEKMCTTITTTSLNFASVKEDAVRKRVDAPDVSAKLGSFEIDEGRGPLDKVLHSVDLQAHAKKSEDQIQRGLHKVSDLARELKSEAVFGAIQGQSEASSCHDCYWRWSGFHGPSSVSTAHNLQISSNFKARPQELPGTWGVVWQIVFAQKPERRALGTPHSFFARRQQR